MIYVGFAMHFGIFSSIQIISRNFDHGLISEVFNLVLQLVKILVICEPHVYNILICINMHRWTLQRFKYIIKLVLKCSFKNI